MAIHARYRWFADRIRGLYQPVDAAGAAAFRIGFGLLMCAGTLRFIASGWIARFYEKPTFLFKYWGFSWVQPWPAWGMYLHFSLLAVLALMIALGLFYRASAVLFFLGFVYAELLDVTNYLNHYYLVSLLALLCAILPLHRTWSIDALRRPELRSDHTPAWVMALLRFQVGTVYLFAGLAKLGSDWLLHAQPLNLWLSARTDLPVIGTLLDEPAVAFAASWFGFLFDTTIVFWLRWHRTRRAAFAVVIVFHVLTRVLFNIGMFPFIMILSATVFFSPSWPRRLLRRECPPSPAVPPMMSLVTWRRTAALTVAAAYGALQIAVPLRHLAYPGNVSWNEEGIRWGWRVMVREKQGAVTFYVRRAGTDRAIQVSPRRYLNSRQEREMAGQPDLILQLAHHIADDFRDRGWDEVEVRAEALVSLNGRPAQPMIDPQVDLAAIDDGIARKRWILPGPTSPPPLLRPQ